MTDSSQTTEQLGPPVRAPREGRTDLAPLHESLPVIYFVGDSHVSVFSGGNKIDPGFPEIADSAFPNVRLCRLGASLAGNMNREGTTTRGREKAFALVDSFDEGATVFLIFGEIDCRVHVSKRAGHDLSRIPATARETAANFLSFVDDFSAVLEARSVRVGLLSTPPTSPFDIGMQDDAFVRFFKSGAPHIVKKVLLNIIRPVLTRRRKMQLINSMSESFAHSHEARKMAIDVFNDALKGYCAARGLPFVDMCTPFLSDDWEEMSDWFMDEIHLAAHSIPVVAPEFARQGYANFLPRDGAG